MEDMISRKAAIDAIMNADVCVAWDGVISDDDAVDIAIRATKGSVIGSIAKLPSAQPTLYGYNIEHLELIARVLQKENLPPERVVEALTDIGRIVAIVSDEFNETLRKAVEQCMT